MQHGTILVCDDNTDILTALQYALEDTFQRIIQLTHPEQLLSTMAAETVDIVLLDMNFSMGRNSGSEGIQWLKTLRERHPDVPVVLLTAYGDVPLAVRALKSGAADFITKPWDNDDLIRKLTEVLTAQREVAPLNEVELAHIRKAVDRADGNLSVAARMLGVTRQTLYNKLNRGVKFNV
ncbi:MAG: response regulator [Bacteroidaceae bacterium]|nr:response regulator [Bacteroidaceae bacterium]